MSKRRLLHTDDAVPQRDRLLDADLVGAMLDAPVRIAHVSYRPGKSLRVVYRAGERRVAARTSGGRTWFWTYPYDRRMPALARVAEPDRSLRTPVGERWTASRLVDYNPGVSAVLECLGDSGEVLAYARVHAGDEGEQTHAVQRTLARVAPFTARPIGFVAETRTLFTEPVRGTRLGELDGRALLDGLRSYGRTLAALHSLPVNGFLRSPRDPLGRLEHRAAGVLLVLPSASRVVRELLDALRGRWRTASDPTGFVPVHGDTNENNAIVRDGDGGVTLIDFERTCAGPAAADLGNLLGLLRSFRLRGLLGPDTERAQAEAFLDGYAAVRPLPDPGTLRTHESAALAERAFRAVARVRTAMLPHVPAILAEARGLLR